MKALRFFASAAVALLASVVCAQTQAPPPGWPVFWHKGIITDKSKSIYNPTNEFIFPSVFHAGRWLKNPKAEW